jgi:hypothetical protein
MLLFLVNLTFNCSDYSLKQRIVFIIVTDEVKQTRKETATDFFNLLTQSLDGRSKEKHGTPLIAENRTRDIPNREQEWSHLIVKFGGKKDSSEIYS